MSLLPVSIFTSLPVYLSPNMEIKVLQPRSHLAQIMAPFVSFCISFIFVYFLFIKAREKEKENLSTEKHALCVWCFSLSILHQCFFFFSSLPRGSVAITTFAQVYSCEFGLEVG